MFRIDYVPLVLRERLSKDYMLFKQTTELMIEITKMFTEGYIFFPRYATLEQVHTLWYLRMLKSEIWDFGVNLAVSYPSRASFIFSEEKDWDSDLSEREEMDPKFRLILDLRISSPLILYLEARRPELLTFVGRWMRVCVSQGPRATNVVVFRSSRYKIKVMYEFCVGQDVVDASPRHGTAS